MEDGSAGSAADNVVDRVAATGPVSGRRLVGVLPTRALRAQTGAGSPRSSGEDDLRALPGTPRVPVLGAGNPGTARRLGRPLGKRAQAAPAGQAVRFLILGTLRRGMAVAVEPSLTPNPEAKAADRSCVPARTSRRRQRRRGPTARSRRSPRGRWSPRSRAWSASARSPQRSTADPARPSDGELPPRPWTIFYAAVNKLVLRAPLEPGQGTPCSESARYKAVRVRLDQPLGDRRLVDGAAPHTE